jgi:SAM-dependent methyltransferase
LKALRRELLIGCGHERLKLCALPDRKEWSDLITLDNREDCHPDVVHDLEILPYPFQTNEFDEIHAYCVLEHMGRQGDYRFFFAQFSEFWRILKPNGLIFGICPKPNSRWAWGDPSHTRIISPDSLSFLEQKRYAEVGSTTMSDFRSIYHADFELGYWTDYDEDRFAFTLVALKGD